MPLLGVAWIRRALAGGRSRKEPDSATKRYAVVGSPVNARRGLSACGT
jgi:hypothetical protein